MQNFRRLCVDCSSWWEIKSTKERQQNFHTNFHVFNEYYISLAYNLHSLDN
jgi:hypothetical protein